MQLSSPWFLAVLAALTLAFGAGQLSALNDMKSRGTDVFGMEFVRTQARAEKMLAGWGPDGKSAARRQLTIDYPFLVSYGLLLAGGALAAGGRLARRFAWAGIGAAAFDAVENTSLLIVIAGHTAQPWPALASAAATVKFLLLAATIVYIAGRVVVGRSE